MTIRIAGTRARWAALLAPCLVLTACKAGKVQTVQTGPRGLGKELNYDIDDVRRSVADNKPPAVIPPVPATAVGPSPYKNVQVLTDVSVPEFNRTMVAFSQWVAPTSGPRAGCTYCHVATNLASDSIYAKVVARRMLQMVRHVNHDWRPHVGNTGITCYTCHRGSPAPHALWWDTNQNQFLRAYLDRDDIRVESVSPYPNHALNRSSVKQTDNTYALMINQSRALGVNCTFCHNSRQFSSWDESSGKRVTALYGMRMVRDLNSNFLTPLHSVFPDSTRGPLGDSPKLQCMTCHNGVYKPLYGVNTVKDYPALWGAPQWDSTDAVVHDVHGTWVYGPLTDTTGNRTVVPPPLHAPSGGAPGAQSPSGGP